MRSFRRRLTQTRSLGCLLLLGLLLSACGPKRLAVLGPMADVTVTVRALEQGTRLAEPVRIDFTWQLNESGSRISGVGVARIEPPYRARLDLFLQNGETVVTAALVGDDLRLPPGSPDDILPPPDLMWSTLGVFRPMGRARLVGGDRLEGQAARLRYRYEDGTELHYEVQDGSMRLLELLEGESVVEWVRLTHDGDDRYPRETTYRNLVDFRELKITRESVAPANPFDPAIFDLRGTPASGEASLAEDHYRGRP